MVGYQHTEVNDFDTVAVRKTRDQTINLTALTGDLCRVSSNVDAIPNAKCRHRFRWCPEPIAFVISPSPFLLLLLIIR